MSLYAALANSTVTSLMFMAVFWKIGVFPDLIQIATDQGIDAAVVAY